MKKILGSFLFAGIALFPAFSSVDVLNPYNPYLRQAFMRQQNNGLSLVAGLNRLFRKNREEGPFQRDLQLVLVESKKTAREGARKTHNPYAQRFFERGRPATRFSAYIINRNRIAGQSPFRTLRHEGADTRRSANYIAGHGHFQKYDTPGNGNNCALYSVLRTHDHVQVADTRHNFITWLLDKNQWKLPMPIEKGGGAKSKGAFGVTCDA